MQRSLLARATLQFLLGVLPCLLSDSILAMSQGTAAEGIPDKTIDQLIADLGSVRFETRDAATRALKKRVEAIPALRKARRSADSEVRRRVEDILLALDRKRASLALGKAKALGKAGRVVEVADRLAFAAKYGVPGEEGWESLTQFADRVVKRTEGYFLPDSSFDRDRGFPVGEFRRYAKLVNPKEIAERRIEIDTGKELDNRRDVKGMAGRKFIKETGGKLLLRGEEVSLTGRLSDLGIRNGMIAASEDVHLSGAISSLIVSGGDIKNVVLLMNGILICDGDVELLWPPRSKSLIFARGNVTCKIGPLRNCLVCSGHTLRMPDGKTIDLKDGTPDSPAFVKFFELADVGIAAEDLPRRGKGDTGGVRLKKVRKESPFSSQLRAGDVITAIEEKTTPTTETFRKVLRRKLAEGGPTVTFTVQRSGKTLDLPIPVKD